MRKSKLYVKTHNEAGCNISDEVQRPEIPQVSLIQDKYGTVYFRFYNLEIKLPAHYGNTPINEPEIIIRENSVGDGDIKMFFQGDETDLIKQLSTEK